MSKVLYFLPDGIVPVDKSNVILKVSLAISWTLFLLSSFVERTFLCSSILTLALITAVF